MGDRAFEFDRYRNGRLMAEGGKVRAKDETEALDKVRRLFRDCPGDTFRLRTKDTRRGEHAKGETHA